MATPAPPTSRDLESAELSSIDWSSPREGIVEARRRITRKGRDAEAWYRDRIRRKRSGAYGLRLVAWGLGTLAALWPVLTPVLKWDRLQPLTAAFVLGAGAAVWLDSFFGFSSGWMRYMTALQDLQDQREQFELAWMDIAQKLDAGTDAERNDARATALTALKTYLLEVNKIVRSETQVWVGEFRSALSERSNAGGSLSNVPPARAPSPVES
jgi:hypothetical protein